MAGGNVQVRCLCGQNNQIVALAAESLPADTRLCHCHACRSTSGMLCFSYLDLTEPPHLSHKLAQYPVSDNEIRYFCEACGTHLWQYSESSGQYRVAAGAIDFHGDVIEIRGHDHVGDTTDGGLTAFFPSNDVTVQHARQQEPTSSAERGSLINVNDESRRLEGRCHCGGAQYVITPPSTESRSASSPWPDLLVPYHSSSSANDEDVKWWLRCGDMKYLAGLCARRSCRLGAGFAIQSWAFVPKVNIAKADGQPLDFRLGTLRQYQSKPGIYREFCSRCGATVFWHCEERPKVIDVSVGPLKAKGGALALEWLDWHTGRVSFAEDAQDQKFVGILEEGLGRFQKE